MLLCGFIILSDKINRLGSYQKNEVKALDFFSLFPFLPSLALSPKGMLNVYVILTIIISCYC